MSAELQPGDAVYYDGYKVGRVIQVKQFMAGVSVQVRTQYGDALWFDVDALCKIDA